MTEKQTCCPNCSSIYKVSVTQLTVAQGMVCCPKCSNNFNALLNLLRDEIKIPDNQDDQSTDPDQFHRIYNTQHQQETNVFDIFNRKVENSNIDLKTYLNNLNYFNNEPINNIPNLNLSQGLNDYKRQGKQPKSKLYYFAWGSINLILLFVLLFQIAWFNHSVTNHHPTINTIVTKVCSIFICETTDQRYKQVIINNLKTHKIDTQQTRFIGQLDNQHSKSLELPLLKVTLKNKNTLVATYTLTPQQYLIESLIGIKRIPQHSPYPFKFTIIQPRSAFDQYQIEVIPP